MAWKAIDFHGIATLDRSLVDQLTRYLDEKESAVGFGVLSIIRSCVEKQDHPTVLPAPTVGIRLSESTEAAARRIRETLLSGKLPVSFEEWQDKVIQRTNTLLWEYVEVLEGGVTELFQQLQQVPLEKWNSELFQVVGEIKVLLMHHIEDSMWAIRRLDQMFWKYRWEWESRKGSYTVLLRRIFSQWSFLIDRSLLTNLEKSRKFLGFNFKKFATRYREYLKLKMRSEQSAQKFGTYQVFNLLDSEARENLKATYLLVKVWHLNNTSKALPKELLVRTVGSAINFAKSQTYFKEYINRLQDTLYARSRLFKEQSIDTLLGDQGVNVQKDIIGGYRAEVHTLWSMISRYREYLLQTDPNPYIRTRWGFSEWTVGPEPAKTQQLLDLEYALEHLDQLFIRLLDAVDKGPMHCPLVRDVSDDIYRWLHEMSQPLTSKNMMRVNGERVVEALQELNELGSFEHGSIEFVGNVLSKALRADWKYHVLFDVSSFEELYQIHCGIVGELHDRNHMGRIHRFDELVKQLSCWVKSRSVNKHAHEIEQDMTDIKEGLQEFYVYVQKLFAQRDVSAEQALQHAYEVSHGLLEYRFLFGKFFHELRENEPDERSIRNRFLFVDQYFESIESLIQEFYNQVIRRKGS